MEPITEKLCKRTMEHLYHWYHGLGFKIPVHHMGEKYLIRVDDDNLVDVERIENRIIITFVCVPCEHDMVKQGELREMMK